MFSAKVHPKFEEIQIFYPQGDTQQNEEKNPETQSSEELQFEMELDTSFVEKEDDIPIRSCHEFPTKFSSPLNPNFINTRKNSAPKHVNILHLKNKIKIEQNLRKKAIKNARRENDLAFVFSNLALIE